MRPNRVSRIEQERLDTEQRDKAAAAAKKAQEEAAIARQEAERVRKEQEEAQRKELEKEEEIRRQEEAEERKKREAEQREEEKEFNKKFNPAFSVIISNGERETVTEATWTSLGFGFSKSRFIEYLKQKRISDSTTSAVIAAFEQNGLAWWEKPAA